MPQNGASYYRYWGSNNGGITATLAAIIIQRNLSIGKRKKGKQLGDFECDSVSYMLNQHFLYFINKFNHFAQHDFNFLLSETYKCIVITFGSVLIS